MRQEVTSRNGHIEVHVDDFIDILEQMMLECQALPIDHPKRNLVTLRDVELYRSYRDSGKDVCEMPGLTIAVTGEIRRRLGYTNAIDQLRAKDWTWLDA